MTIELKMLAFSIVLGFVQLILAAQTMTWQRGVKWNLSARDQSLPGLTGLAGRLDRAFKNFLETFAFFMGAVLLVTLTKTESSLTAMGAQLYFYGRVLYVPLYVFELLRGSLLLWEFVYSLALSSQFETTRLLLSFE